MVAMSNTLHALDFLSSAQDHSDSAVIVVFGDEPFLKRLVIQRLRDRILGDDDADVPYATFEGDSTTWRDIFLANKEAVLEMLGRFNEDVAALARAIRWGDGDALFELFTRTRAIRRGIVEMGQDLPDFGRPHPELPEAPMPRPYAAED